MAFQTLNGYDVEHASQLLIYDNLFPEIQHINGKGCNDTYTKTSDVESVTYIDVMRVLPYAPRFRKLGGTNNGAWHNTKNEGGYGNAPQSTKYTIPVDLIYDEGVQISDSQIYSNPVALQSVIMAQLVKTAGLSINIITYAKQIEAFFLDSFPASGATADELAAAVYSGTASNAANVEGSYADAFIAANSSLTEGCIEIGALQIPLEARQAFITPSFDRVMKRQYMSNASEAAAKILANGFINPFNDSPSARINSATGLAGTYDGVDMFIYNSVTRSFVELALGIQYNVPDVYETLTKQSGSAITAVAIVDATFISKVASATGTYTFTYASSGSTWKLSGNNATLSEYGITVTGAPADGDVIAVAYTSYNQVANLLRQMRAMIVYGEGTCRGIVGPSLVANPNPFFGGVYILPKMKVGVEVLNGKTIRMVIDGSWTTAQCNRIRSTIQFTPIDGAVVTGSSLYSGAFNSGANN